MTPPPLILVVDDNPENRDILSARLTAQGYRVITGEDGERALELVREHGPDLVLLDIMMPKIDGVEVCRRIKTDPGFDFVPIILVTAKSDPSDVVAGLEAGAEEYLTKPVDQTALIARVRSMLRIKRLHDDLAELNRGLERRVAEQVGELQKLSQLKRFFSPRIVDHVLSSGDDAFMQSHRSKICVLTCDIRGFTAFSGAAEPEEEIQLVREYHEVVGALVFHHGATLEHIAGDGLMAFFNDPVPCSEPPLRAAVLALQMRTQVSALLTRWTKRGFNLGFGIGIAQGYATLGHIGVEGQFHYAAVGSVSNLSARLCDHAGNGQILVEPRVYAEIDEQVVVEPVGELGLKGFRDPVAAYNVVDLAPGVVTPQ